MSFKSLYEKDAKGDQTSNQIYIPHHIKFLDKNNQKQVDAFYEREILIMKHLREIRHGQSPFRNTIFD